MNNIWKGITSVLSPVAALIDEVHTSEEERLTIKSKLFETQSSLVTQIMDYEARLAESRACVITAEAQGNSWLQRNWRPITMLTFLLLVVLDALGILTNRLPPEAWTLLQVGLGGYVVGRSVEKVVPQVTQAMKKD